LHLDLRKQDEGEEQDVGVEAEKLSAGEALQRLGGLVEEDEEEASEADNQGEVAACRLLGIATLATGADNLDTSLAPAPTHSHNEQRQE
jgi:hypothetical protein